jgi:hypothetical protein
MLILPISNIKLISGFIIRQLLERILELLEIVMSWATGIQRNVLNLNGRKDITGSQCNLCTQTDLISSTSTSNTPMDTLKTVWTD